MVIWCVDDEFVLGSFLRETLMPAGPQAEGKAEAVLEVRGGSTAFLGHNLQVQ